MNQDWDEVETLQESLREHMAEINRLRAAGWHALYALSEISSPLLVCEITKIGLAMSGLRAALTEHRSADTGKTSDHIPDATKMVATINGMETVEPVAYMMVNKTHGHASSLHFTAPENWHVTWEAVPLYMAPPKREPLTESFLDELAEKHVTNCYFDTLTYARAIERAHGIGGEE